MNEICSPISSICAPKFYIAFRNLIDLFELAVLPSDFYYNRIWRFIL